MNTASLGSQTEAERIAMMRWKTGHHAFHVILVAMNTELPEAQALLERREWPGLCDTLDRLTVLYDAATASMRYAADFAVEQYAAGVRPSMSPPWVSPGFSGSANRDHEQMVTELRDLNRALKRQLRAVSTDVPDRVRRSATRLWMAQSRNRRSHSLICEKFVPGGASLLAEYLDAVASANPPTTEDSRGIG